MKAIKKVEVTPIDYNIGKIIDSASTTDDKTKNTYSMRVINGKFSDVDDKIDDAFENTSTNFKGTWDGITNDLTTENNSSSKLPILNDDKIQYREISNIISSYNIITTGNFSVINGTASVNPEDANEFGPTIIDYPTGFTKSNCVPVAVGVANANGEAYAFGSWVDTWDSIYGLPGDYWLSLRENNMVLRIHNNSSGYSSVRYRIVLMKIS